MGKSFYSGNPLTIKVVDEIAQHITDLGNVIITSLPTSGITTFGNSLTQPNHPVTKMLANALSPKILQVIYLDLDFELPQLFEQVAMVTNTQIATHPQMILQSLIAANYVVYFFLDNCNRKNLDKIKQLASWQNLSRDSIHYIFCFKESEYLEMRTDLTFGRFYQSIVHIPLLTKEEASEWLEICASEMKKIITVKDTEMIIKFGGGFPGLIKKYLRAFLQTADHASVFQNEMQISYFYVFWHYFLPLERKILSGLVLDPHGVNELSPAYQYFQKYGLIDRQGKLTASWPEKYLQINRLEFFPCNEMLCSDDFDCQVYFTLNEQKFLLKLLTSEETICTRDQLVELLWGKDYSSKYSAWAMDQFVSRLRQKLEKIGYAKNYISTLKKKGFKINR